MGIAGQPAKLVKQIVAEIEAHEGKPASELSREQVGNYIEQLSDILAQLSKAQLQADANYDKSILESLGREVP